MSEALWVASLTRRTLRQKLQFRYSFQKSALTARGSGSPTRTNLLQLHRTPFGVSQQAAWPPARGW
ncbi:hypothetical protein PBI_BIGMAMA_41 [Mycobacterium phage BigMama]|uniref:Uncharacterized protein n=1 Tax=Mycobacterium phage BigMama TaxID=2126786 RepID=A0A2P1N561_9CAUD|nr:hypothetical protein PBI_BIGMAMA_41 [Mycobacterium phage BigMama]